MNELRRPGWLTVAVAGASGFLIGVLLVAALGGAKGPTKTKTVVHTRTRTITRTLDTRPTVPDVTGLGLDDARSQLEGLGYHVQTVDDSLFGILDESNYVVSDQRPDGETKLSRGGTVTLTVDHR